MNPSLYIHIPVCVRKCDYCDFFSVPLAQFPANGRNESLLEPLVKGLIDELSLKKTEFHIDGWKTVYIGGGTPSLLSPENILLLCAAIAVNRKPSSANFIEMTIEANPEDLTPEWLAACMTGGINRLSLGIQSMQDCQLVGVGRRGSRMANLAALELVREVWKGSLSLDLISGLPGQTAETLTRDILEILSYKPEHVSLYSLTIEEGTPLEKKLKASVLPGLPNEDEGAALWIMGRDLLEKNGYMQYEISNFALEGHESAHNQTYWNLDSYIGIGPGATGTIAAGDCAFRNTNTCDSILWLNSPGKIFETEQLSRKECIQEVLLMGMRLSRGISRDRFKDRFKTDIMDLIERPVRDWKKRGLLEFDGHYIRLNRSGLLLLNRFLSDCMEELC